MGIETMAAGFAAGATAAQTTAALSVLSAYGTGLGALSSIAGGVMNRPKQQNPGGPAKPPTPSHAPVADVFKEKNQGAARGGPSSTLLTAMGGVPNSSLNLGRNTLLGA
jgi:hypothetical protein